MSSKTMLHDKATGKTYVGSFSPSGYHTAHQQLANAAGISDTSQCVGGAVSWNGTMKYKSESMNAKNFGQCEIHGNNGGMQQAKEDLASASYYAVSKNGNVNPGQKYY